MRDTCGLLIAGQGAAGGDRRATGDTSGLHRSWPRNLSPRESGAVDPSCLVRRAPPGSMPPKDSGCLTPVVTTTGGSTTRRILQLANRRCAALRGPRLASARVSRAWCRGWLCPRLLSENSQVMGAITPIGPISWLKWDGTIKNQRQSRCHPPTPPLFLTVFRHSLIFRQPRPTSSSSDGAEQRQGS